MDGLTDRRQRIATHEAGHAVMAIALGCRVRGADVDAAWWSGGRVDADLPAEGRERRLVTAAGIAAVGLVLGAEDVAHADRAELGDDLEAAVTEALEILAKRRNIRRLGRVSAALLRDGHLDERQIAAIASRRSGAVLAGNAGPLS